MREKPWLQQSWRGKDWKGETRMSQILGGLWLVSPKGSCYPDTLFHKNASIVLPALGPFSFLYLRTVQTYKTYSLFAQKPKGDEQGYPSGLIGKIQTDQKPNAIWLTSGRSSNWIKLPLNMISLGLLKPGTKTYVRVSCYTNGCTELQPRPQGLISWRLFLSLYCPAENWLSYLWAPGANGMAPQNTTVTDWSELLGIYGLIITRRKKKGPWGRQQGTGKL